MYMYIYTHVAIFLYFYLDEFCVYGDVYVFCVSSKAKLRLMQTRKRDIWTKLRHTATRVTALDLATRCASTSIYLSPSQAEREREWANKDRERKKNREIEKDRDRKRER